MSELDINQVQAGEYELIADLWDERTSELDKPFEFVRHVRGDKVTLNQEDARRLVAAGAVAPVGAREAAELEAAKARYLAALAAVPDELRPQLTEEKALESFGREIPVEELTVATAPGHPNVGERPRVAEATTGEGTGGPENEEKAQEADTPQQAEDEAQATPSTVDTAKRTGRTGRGA
jgi:hypothetical protein